MDNIIRTPDSHMGQGCPPKMDSAHQKIVFQVLEYARNSRSFDSIVGWQHPIAGREEMHVKLAIDEPAQKVENMCRGPFRAGHDIESSIQNSGHGLII